jgi:polysaccharide deacetylase family protein (PEP-CTERM system associated)
MQKNYLFSIDLEDVRFWMENGLKYSERVPLMTERYLEFLQNHNFKITFFVVGDVAKVYPNLIRKIVEGGHEVACHSNKHIPIDKQNHQSFSEDLAENIKVLHDCGVENLYGFRAPIFSVIEKTKWVYPILADLGFVYSSSVLPAKNPLYGWPEHERNVVIHEKIVEIPMTLFNFGITSIPAGGGIYFRLMPPFILRNIFNRKWKSEQPILGYFHPYDIDDKQEHFMHPGINNNKISNKLMYVNRSKTLLKLEKIFKTGCRVIPYFEYVKGLNIN